MNGTRLILALWLTLWLAVAPYAAVLQVAVASNAIVPVRQIARTFEARTGAQVNLSPGSTGRHYAQILNGAPFQVFLAADAERPRLLEAEGHALPGTRVSWAIGQLVLFSPQPGLVDTLGQVLGTGDFRHIALANPTLAPYGLAARETLEALGLWHTLQDRIVLGENVAQAWQFVASGSAELGFVAASQLLADGGSLSGSRWAVPDSLHSPVIQQAVLLKDDPLARQFLEFLVGDEARAILRAAGYGLP